MTNKLLYLLPLLFVLASGCLGDKNSNPSPNNTPGGTFAGHFTYLHLNEKTGAVDSMSANLDLSIEKSGFAVTGDTSAVHAGSYGTWMVNSTYTAIDFLDKTYPLTGTPVKSHLDGVYSYQYNGQTLVMVGFGPLDTLEYYYRFTRTGN